MQPAGDGDRHGERGSPRIEIEQDEVGAVETPDTGQPRVERERTLIRQEQERRQIVDQHVLHRLAVLRFEFDAGVFFCQKCAFPAPSPSGRRSRVTGRSRRNGSSFGATLR